MAIIETKKTDIEKLVEDMPLVSYDLSVPKKTFTKKRIRKTAKAHIRPHTIKHKEYYYYVRGADRPVYLGDADTILKAVKSMRYAGK